MHANSYLRNVFNSSAFTIYASDCDLWYANMKLSEWLDVYRLTHSISQGKHGKRDKATISFWTEQLTIIKLLVAPNVINRSEKELIYHGDFQYLRNHQLWSKDCTGIGQNRKAMSREQYVETPCDCNCASKEGCNDVTRYEIANYHILQKTDGLTINVILLWIQYGINSSPLDKMGAISQMTFSNAFSWMKIYEYGLKCHWSLFPGGQLTIFQNCFR